MTTSLLIHFTKPAIAHIKTMMMQMPRGIGFRLTIKKTGCSGFAYKPSIVEEINTGDIHMEIEGLQVFVDPTFQDLLMNVTVDYVDDNVGLKQKRLVFINPYEKNRCGCGESFTIE